MAFDETLATRIREALARKKGVEEKKLFGCICFFINGNALAGVWKDRLIARLGPDEGEAALREQHVRAFANMPVGTPHSFKNESNKPARMLISVAPASMEQMLFEVGLPLTEEETTALPPRKEEIEKLLAAAPLYGIEIKLPGH